MKKGIKNVVLLSVCTAFSLLCGCQKKEAAEKMSTVVKVDTQFAKTGELSLSTDYIGSVAPGEQVNVMPLVSGTVKSVKVKKGDKVKEGDVLCKFDDKAAQLTKKNAEIGVKSAKAGKQTAIDQANISAAQTQASIDSLKSQLAAYKDSLGQAKVQKTELQNSLNKLLSGMQAAQDAVTATKTVYKAAENLYLNYKSFLTMYPDCQTTAGLNLAAQEVEGMSMDGILPDITPETMPDLTPDLGGLGATEETPGLDAGGLVVDPEPVPTPEVPTPVVPETPVPTQKALIAQSLIEALATSNLTVEYLNDQGIGLLQESVTEAQNAYDSVAASYGQAKSGIATLDNSIKSLEAQVKGTKEGIATAEKTQKLSKKATADSVDAVENQIDAAEVGLESAEYQEDLYVVKAPMDGVIESVNVKKNEVFGTGMPAFVLSNKNSASVSFYVTEEARDFLEIGDEAIVESKGEEYKAYVSEIATAVDQQRGLFLIKAMVDLKKGEDLSSGSSVTVSVVTSKTSGGILIPYDSVYYDDNQAYVFCIEDGRASRVDVQTGLYNEDTIEITEGVTSGDEVVTSWASGLKNGAVVEVKEK